MNRGPYPRWFEMLTLAAIAVCVIAIAAGLFWGLDAVLRGMR